MLQVSPFAGPKAVELDPVLATVDLMPFGTYMGNRLIRVIQQFG